MGCRDVLLTLQFRHLQVERAGEGRFLRLEQPAGHAKKKKHLTLPSIAEGYVRCKGLAQYKILQAHVGVPSADVPMPRHTPSQPISYYCTLELCDRCVRPHGAGEARFRKFNIDIRDLLHIPNDRHECYSVRYVTLKLLERGLAELMARYSRANTSHETSRISILL